MDARQMQRIKAGDMVAHATSHAVRQVIERHGDSNNPRRRWAVTRLVLDDASEVTLANRDEYALLEGEAREAAILRAHYEHDGFADNADGRRLASLFAWMDDGELLEAAGFEGGPYAWMCAFAVDNMDCQDTLVYVSSPGGRKYVFPKPLLDQPDGPGNPHWTARFFVPARP